jgi:hypothetical protein
MAFSLREKALDKFIHIEVFVGGFMFYTFIRIQSLAIKRNSRTSDKTVTLITDQ